MYGRASPSCRTLETLGGGVLVRRDVAGVVEQTGQVDDVGAMLPVEQQPNVKRSTLNTFDQPTRKSGSPLPTTATVPCRRSLATIWVGALAFLDAVRAEAGAEAGDGDVEGRAIGRSVTVERFSVRIARDVHSNGSLSSGRTCSAASTPRLRIAPPLKNSFVKPVDVGSARCSSRLQMLRW